MEDISWPLRRRPLIGDMELHLELEYDLQCEALRAKVSICVAMSAVLGWGFAYRKISSHGGPIRAERESSET